MAARASHHIAVGPRPIRWSAALPCRIVAAEARRSGLSRKARKPDYAPTGPLIPLSERQAPDSAITAPSRGQSSR